MTLVNMTRTVADGLWAACNWTYLCRNILTRDLSFEQKKTKKKKLKNMPNVRHTWKYACDLILAILLQCG